VKLNKARTQGEKGLRECEFDPACGFVEGIVGKWRRMEARLQLEGIANPGQDQSGFGNVRRRVGVNLVRGEEPPYDSAEFVVRGHNQDVCIEGLVTHSRNARGGTGQ
jgi:hypothetical protein